MALDQAYFDAIHINVVKRKYYPVSEVEAVFADIRRQAQTLQEENEALQRQLGEKSDPNAGITDAVYSAQGVYRVIIERANRRAEDILADAERQRLEILEEANRQRDYSVQAVDECLQRVREQQQAAVESINAAWQDFLCGLYPEKNADSAGQAEPTEVPADLEEKVGAIARELFSMEE